MTQPVQEPSQGRTDQGQEYRTRQLFRRPAIVNPDTPGVQRPIFGFTAVQAQRTTPTKWPGAMRVVPCYGFEVAGTEVNESAYAFRQVSHDQTAASYAAAADTLSATVDDWLLDSTIRYQCWIGVKVASNAATANVGISSTAIGTNEINLTGTPSDNYALYRLFSDKTFGAGETITVKSYRTASSGAIKIDQLYFFPSNATAYKTGPSAQMQANIAAIAIASFADLGPTAGTASDSRFASTIVNDTQTANDYKDAEASAWSFLVAPQLYNVMYAATAEFDDELRIFRHNYVTACYDSAADSTFQEGCFVSLAGDGIPQASARVYLPSAGLYYLGPSTPYGAPPQLTLWRNAAVGSSVPYQDDATATTTDVRVGEYFAISSYLDDYY